MSARCQGVRAALTVLTALVVLAPASAALGAEPATSGSRLFVQLSGGGGGAFLFNTPGYGGNFTLMIGGEGPRSVVGGYLHGLIGKSELGLDLRSFQTGVALFARSDRARIGGGFHAAYVGVERVTAGSALEDLGVGFRGEADVDLWSPSPHFDLFAGLSVEANVYLFTPGLPAMTGGVLFLGVRYR